MRFRDRIRNVALALAFSLLPGAAAATPIEVVPASGETAVGSLVPVEIRVAGLGVFAAPSLGVFDLDVVFDASVLALESVAFAAFLGGAGDVVTEALARTGSVNLFAVSLLPPAALDALQPASFVLATLSFRALALGGSTIDVLPLTLGDTLGAPLSGEAGSAVLDVTAIPEPGSAVLVALGLALAGALPRSLRGPRRRAGVAAASLAAVLVLTGCDPGEAGEHALAYDIVDLGRLEPVAMNDAGQIAGNLWGPGSDEFGGPLPPGRRIAVASRAALWEDGEVTMIGDPNTRSVAYDVNEGGDVVGDTIGANGYLQAFRWLAGAPELLDQGAGIESRARAIGDSGRVVGQVYDRNVRCIGEGYQQRAATWEPVQGVLEFLPSPSPPPPPLSHNCWDFHPGSTSGINAHDEIVGNAGPQGVIPPTYVVWRNGVPSVLPFAGLAINDAGDVVSVDRVLRADGTTVMLETPAGFSAAAAINERGIVVGVHRPDSANETVAVSWTDGVFTDLNAHIDPESGWVLGSATDIDRRGRIVGTGTFAGERRGFLLKPRRNPVFVIPGIAGTASIESSDMLWLLNRGVDPALLQIDPLGNVYADLIRTLENVGYEHGEDLFVVVYDWRLPPGPDDGSIDGRIDGISAESITDDQFAYAVDYLGYFLREAVECWEEAHPGRPLEKVDVIAHSTGGLVARSYLQSAAYAAVYDVDRTLPEVENLIFLGVPNRGASKAWNPLRDNWVIDPAFQMVLSKILNRAYEKVLAGWTISGPEYDIDLGALTPPECLDLPTVCFVQRYVPTIRALLATYPFIDFGAGFTHVNDQPAVRNTQALDLNAGLDLALVGDPNAFADLAKLTVIYGTNGGLLSPAMEEVLGQISGTPTAVVQRTGPTSSTFSTDVIAEFANLTARNAAPGEVWYDDVKAPFSGDGTVPIDSSAGQFVGDDRVTLRPFTQAVPGTPGNTLHSVGHTELVSNPEVQAAVLETLGVDFEPTDLSAGLQSPALSAVACAVTGCWNFLLDPAEGVLVDGAGRRLGWTLADGVLTEIPGSVWFGGADGIGWVFGPVRGPLSLALGGLGESYSIAVSGLTPFGATGIAERGLLAAGAPRLLEVAIAGDLDLDRDVDRDDLAIVLAARNTPAIGAGDPRDLNGDLAIDGLDSRELALLCTRPSCATE